MADSGYITPFQRQVAQAFFAMPESRGFLLVGGSALDQVTTIRSERFPIAPERVAEMIAFFTGWAGEIRTQLLEPGAGE